LGSRLVAREGEGEMGEKRGINERRNVFGNRIIERLEN
jgi:hypothetical protein